MIKTALNLNGYAITEGNHQEEWLPETGVPRRGERVRKSAALQIIQLAELVKRFAHNGVNVGEMPRCCTITGRKGRQCGERGGAARG